jgi:hypothetical protein
MRHELDCSRSPNKLLDEIEHLAERHALRFGSVKKKASQLQTEQKQAKISTLLKLLPQFMSEFKNISTSPPKLKLEPLEKGSSFESSISGSLSSVRTGKEEEVKQPEKRSSSLAKDVAPTTNHATGMSSRAQYEEEKRQPF